MTHHRSASDGAAQWHAARWAIDMSTHPAVCGDQMRQQLWLMRAQVHATLALAAPGLDLDEHGAHVDEHQDQGDEDQAPAGIFAAEPLVICGHYGPDFPAPGAVCILPVGIHEDGQHRGHRVPGLEDLTPRTWPQLFVPLVVDELAPNGADVADELDNERIAWVAR